MDEELTDAADTAATTEEQPAEEGVSRSLQHSAADAPPISPPAPIDINQLLNASPKQLRDVAHEFDLRVFSSRSRHGTIVDIVRAALSRGGIVTAEGFVDFSPESPVATLRYPELNFLSVPEDICIPRALIQQHQFRPGQQIGGKIRLP